MCIFIFIIIIINFSSCYCFLGDACPNCLVLFFVKWYGVGKNYINITVYCTKDMNKTFILLMGVCVCFTSYKFTFTFSDLADALIKNDLQ